MEDYLEELIENWVASEDAGAPGAPECPLCTPPSFGALVCLLAAEALGKDTTYQGSTFLAKVVEVHDGDTVRVKFWDRGRVVQLVARLAGYDSPELHPKRDAPDRVAEMAAAAAARNALIGHIGGDGLVYIECGKYDKYGRLLTTMRMPNGVSPADGPSVNDWMISNGHGRPYAGKKKKPWSARRVLN